MNALIILGLLLGLAYTEEQEEEQAACSWTSPTGEYYDLLPLKGKPIKAMYLTSWEYTVYPCAEHSQKCGAQDKTGFCQSNPARPSENFNVGHFNSFTVQDATTPNTITMTYTGGDPAEGQVRGGTVIVTCEPNAKEPTGMVANNPPLNNLNGYQVKFHSMHACQKKPGSNGLSGGSVLLILLFVFFAVYLIGGVAFNKFRNEATGIDLVPNLEFWQTFPHLVKEGCLFTYGKVTGRI